MTGTQRFVETFFNIPIAWRYLPELLNGAVVTVFVALAIVVTGLLAGALLAWLRVLAPRRVRWVIVAFVDVMRALPPLVVIIVLYFALPYVGWSMSGYVATWLALSLILAAFGEEVFWGAILAVPKGQWEAARATGMTRVQTLLYVVVPQSKRMTIAPLTNRVVAITKNTALGSVVAMPDVLSVASSALSNSGNATPLVLAALIYLAIFIPVIMAARHIEVRYTRRHA